MKTLNVKTKDTVQIIAGKEIGKRGKVLKVLPDKDRVIVERVNFIHKHQRARRQGEQGGILEIEAPLHISNVMVVCPNCNKPTRVGKAQLADGKRARVCKKCDEIIDK